MFLASLYAAVTPKYYAAVTTKPVDQTAFFDSGIGQMLQNVAKPIAMLVVCLGVYQVVKGVAQGRGALVAKSLVATVVVAALMFNLQWLVNIIDMVIKLIGALIDTVGGSL